MTTVRLNPAQLPAALRTEAQRQKTALQAGMVAAAKRYEAHLVRLTKDAGKVDQGEFMASWKTATLPHVTVYNDAPHAAIIEYGARPHPVSQAGREALARWFARKLGLSAAQAASAAEGLARKLSRYGQKGTFLVASSLDEAVKFLATEVQRRLVRT